MSPALHMEEIASTGQFRHLATVPGIALDLRYATPDNFVGRDLYSPYDCAWLHRDAAAGLEQVVAWPAAHHPGVTALVLDALRPQRVQEQLWAALDGTPLRMYLADPARGSIHSFGMALDMTLIGPDGCELDMGTGFDDLSERSHPAREAQLLASGALTAAQVGNRQVLRDAMGQSGFHGINSEWWHFDFGDRELVRRQYRRVL